MRQTLTWAVATWLLLLGACGERPESEGMRVFVSIAPQAYFVEQIAGDLVEVDVLVSPGQSPATYEPSPRQVTRLQRARVYFRIGVPFEDGLVEKIRAMAETLRIVDTREGITLRTMKGHRHHDEGRDGHNERGAKDPHIWLDPRLVKVQAATIAKALAELDPSHADVFRERLAAFHRRLDAVDARLREALAPLKGRKLLVFHPAYGYFADAYGLEQEPIELEGKRPTARQLVRLIEQARSDKAKVIFVQPQFSAASAEVIAREIGGAVVPMDPLARDYLKNLEDMADKIQAALQ